MTRIRVTALLLAALMLPGCAGAADEPADAAESPATAEEAAAEGQVHGKTNGEGEMVFTYLEADAPDAVEGRRIFEDAGFLEDVAADVNSMLILPSDVQLVGAQCGEANAYWSPSEQTLTMCYELVVLDQQLFSEAGDPDPTASALNASYATFYHELGHMAISLYTLPITGREEDVADQLSAYMLLYRGDDGQLDPESVQAAIDSAREYRAFSQLDGGTVDESAYADVHSLDETRSYNLLCWVYGADPDANAAIVTEGQLPEDRAAGCPEEFAQLEFAWETLLDPHFR